MPVDTVEIQEPPIESINKKHSCVRRSCVTGCGCLLFLVLGAAALVIWSSKPNIETYQRPPEIIPADLPLYDSDNINTIVYTAGRKPQPLLDGAVIGAKIIMSPALYAWQKFAPESLLPAERRNPDIADVPWQDAFYDIITSRPAPITDQVVIEWQGLPATVSFITDYYTKELKKKRFTITESVGNDTNRTILFSRYPVQGRIEITNNADTPGTDAVRMTLIFLTTSP